MRLTLLSGLLVIIFSVGCRLARDRKADEMVKIPIHSAQVFDLSGYAGGGGGNPFNLFDENALVDPRYEQPGDNYLPATNCQPTIHPAIYFHGREGNRIVVDLLADYRLREIYYFDRSPRADSCWIYSGEMKKWMTVVAFNSGVQNGTGRWKKISLDINTRYLMIRFSSYETEITEMVLYGTPLNVIQDTIGTLRPKGFTKTPLREFLGVNYIMEREPRFMKPFHYSRLYNFALDYDNDTTHDQNRVRYNMLHYGYYDREKAKYIFDIDTIQRFNRNEIWYSIRGVSAWMSALGYSDKDRPVNNPGLDTEDPESYSRHAEMMWHMSAFFGYQKVDTNLLSLSNAPRRSGRGSMHIYENGNEEDATWVGNKYCSPYEYYAQSTADWDADEERLGPRHGIHNADSSARLMMSGLIGLDTNRVRVYDFLCRTLRTDQKFIWQGGIQYHYYANKKDQGISPESDTMRKKLSAVAEFSFRVAPLVKCFLGENGYDKSPFSRQRTPLIPGKSASQSQGIMLLRSINAVFFSGFDAYILYWLRDGFPEEDPRVYLTSGVLRGMPDGTTKVYPGWYYISTLVQQLGNYLPDQVVQENGSAWVYKYRHAQYRDSVAYFLYKPATDGSGVTGFELKTGPVSGNMVHKISFADDSESGITENWPARDGRISISVSETPTLILVKEGSPTP